MKLIRVLSMLVFCGAVLLSQTQPASASSAQSHALPIKSSWKGPGFSNATLNGAYVFHVSGRDTFAKVPPGAYGIVGVLDADGQGNISTGEQLYSDQPYSKLDSITGSYSVDMDGRGTITLDTGDSHIGVNGVETFSIALLSGVHGLMAQFDTSATSSGALDLQNTQASKTILAGGYAFVSSGVDVNDPRGAMGLGGVFNVDSPGNISGSGSVADVNDNGAVTAAATLSGTVAAPDPFGKVVVNLTLNSTNYITLIGFIVDATHVRLIENDTSFGTTSGIAMAQGNSTGTFTSDSAFDGTFVYGTQGYGTQDQTTLLPTVYGGLFTADGSGNIVDGYTDENEFGSVIDDTLSGTYAVDSSGTGRTTSSTFYGSNGSGPTLNFYLTGATDIPALTLQVDASPFIETAGNVYAQASGPFTASSFEGPYAANFSAFPATGGEDDGTGEIASDGVSSISGTVDVNYDFSPASGQSLSGSYTANSDGRFTGSLTAGSVFNSDAEAFYIINTTEGLFVETDAQPAVGIFETSSAGGPYATLYPTSLTFPDQVILTTSGTQPVTLTNTGGGDMTISGIAISGPFSQTNNCGKSLGVGQYCTFKVDFHPKFKGLTRGVLTITDNAPGSPQKVPLKGIGTYVQLVPAKLSFADQKVGTKSKPEKITLTNKGSVTVHITSLGITGADAGDFSETNNCGKSVASGKSCTITVRFAPLVKGLRSADVSVYDDGGGSPQLVPLSGTGT
jgi:hypothetical protein